MLVNTGKDTSLYSNSIYSIHQLEYKLAFNKHTKTNCLIFDFIKYHLSLPFSRQSLNTKPLLLPYVVNVLPRLVVLLLSYSTTELVHSIDMFNCWSFSNPLNSTLWIFFLHSMHVTLFPVPEVLYDSETP